MLKKYPIASLIMSSLLFSSTALSLNDSPYTGNEGIFIGPNPIAQSIDEDENQTEYSLRSFQNTTFDPSELNLEQEIGDLMKVFESDFFLAVKSEKPSQVSLSKFIFTFVQSQKSTLEKIRKEIFSEENKKANPNLENEIHFINLGISYAKASAINGQQPHKGGLGSSKATKDLYSRDFEDAESEITSSIGNIISSTQKRTIPKFIGFFTRIALKNSATIEQASEETTLVTNQLVFALQKLDIPLKDPIVNKLPTTVNGKSETELKLTHLKLDSSKTLMVIEFIVSNRRLNPEPGDLNRKSNIPMIIKFGPFEKITEGLVQLGKQKVKFLPYLRAKDPVKMGFIRIYVDIEFRQLGFVLYPTEFEKFLIPKTLQPLKAPLRTIEAQEASVGISAGIASIGLRRIFNLSYEHERSNEKVAPLFKASKKSKPKGNNPAKQIVGSIDDQLKSLEESKEAKILADSIINKMMGMILPLFAEKMDGL